MAIHPLEPTAAAVARLNRIELGCSVAEAAARLARWEAGRGSLITPVRMLLTKSDSANGRPGFYSDRVKKARKQIADKLGMDDDQADRISFTMTGDSVWYLGSAPNLEASQMEAAAEAEPAKFLQLMLQKSLLDSATFDDDIFVHGGFGPGVYLGHKITGDEKYIHLNQAIFDISQKFRSISCDVGAHRFVRKTESESGAATRLAHAGEGFLVPITRISPRDYIRLDARSYRQPGVTLVVDAIRTSRIYYINLVTEFATTMLAQADVPFKYGCFTATHFIDDGYIPLSSVNSLVRPVVIVNATSQPINYGELAEAISSPDYLTPYHVAATEKVRFSVPRATAVAGLPETVDPEQSYLFLNGRPAEEGGSVRYAKNGAVEEMVPMKPFEAYAALAKGEGVADPYTQFKFTNLIAQRTYHVATQGLNCYPVDLETLPRGRCMESTQRQLQEAIKRCFEGAQSLNYSRTLLINPSRLDPRLD
jgi:hypothetical protein